MDFSILSWRVTLVKLENVASVISIDIEQLKFCGFFLTH